MRQLYETAADLELEAATADVLTRAWGCQLVKSPPLACYDFTAYRDGRIAGIVEVRGRRNRDAFDFGGEVFFDVHKARALLAAADELGCGAAFVWRFRDQIRWIDVSTVYRYPVEVRGRTDRDGKDVIPARRIPVADTHRVAL